MQTSTHDLDMCKNKRKKQQTFFLKIVNVHSRKSHSLLRSNKYNSGCLDSVTNHADKTNKMK